MTILLELASLSVRPAGAAAPAVSDLELEIEEGASLAVVGASGAGKSTLARALVGLEGGLSGSLRHRGRELVGAAEPAWRDVRREVALCWQDPAGALDPRRPVGWSIGEARVLAGLPPLSEREQAELLARVELDEALLQRRPGQLSGGQRQRAALVRALAPRPRLLIADEVTSALDRAVALEIAGLLADLCRAGTALLFITHDLSLLPGLVDEAVVLAGGRAVERGPTPRLLASPTHASTRALVDAIPRWPEEPAGQ